MYRLEVLAGGLQWITQNQRLEWPVRNQRTQGWRLATFLHARQQRIPHMVRARIVCELRFTDCRRRDPGNWAPTAKACVDGLVDAGVFLDDDHTRVIGPDMRMGPTVTQAHRGLHLLIHPLRRVVS